MHLVAQLSRIFSCTLVTVLCNLSPALGKPTPNSLHMFQCGGVLAQSLLTHSCVGVMYRCLQTATLCTEQLDLPPEKWTITCGVGEVGAAAPT